MPLAIKNGLLIVKNGSIAENCSCCGGGWYCCEQPCDISSVSVLVSPQSEFWHKDYSFPLVFCQNAYVNYSRGARGQDIAGLFTLDLYQKYPVGDTIVWQYLKQHSNLSQNLVIEFLMSWNPSRPWGDWSLQIWHMFYWNVLLTRTPLSDFSSLHEGYLCNPFGPALPPVNQFESDFCTSNASQSQYCYRIAGPTSSAGYSFSCGPQTKASGVSVSLSLGATHPNVGRPPGVNLEQYGLVSETGSRTVNATVYIAT